MRMKVRCECGNVVDVHDEDAGGPPKCDRCGRTLHPEGEMADTSGAGEGPPAQRSILDYGFDELSLETEEQQPEPPSQARPRQASGHGQRMQEQQPAEAELPEEHSEEGPSDRGVAPPLVAEEEEPEELDIRGQMRTFLTKPKTLAEIDLYEFGKRKPLIQIAKAFLVLNTVPSLFEAARLWDGFFSVVGHTIGMFVMRAVVIAVFIALLKLLTIQYSKESPPVANIAAGILLAHGLAIVWFTPLFALNILIGLTALVGVAPPVLMTWVMYASLWVWALITFYYQLFVLKQLFGEGCLGMVVMNMVGVYAASQTPLWLLT